MIKINNKVINYPTIPTDIIVHIGPPDKAGKNITVPFVDYIKNVASHEVYPTWPESAIEANILAQLSFALNRVYNEWYPSKGYSFDITSSPMYDQTYVEDSQVFDVISKKVDELFNNYIYRSGQIQPLFAIYCDGRNTTCNGLSQWGSVDLAKQGKTPIQILRYYYGNDVNVFENAPTGELISAYPGYPVKLGDGGDTVRIIQNELNRISNNYPAIPKIPRINGAYGVNTENAVKKFQEVFGLNVTGVVDYSTWYRIKYIYNAVKRLSDIYSEGITEDEASFNYGNILEYGNTGPYVRILHYILSVIAFFDPELPLLKVNGVYNDNTKTMITNFQNKYNLTPTGIADLDTQYRLREVYINTINNIPLEYREYKDELFPGRILAVGMTGNDVRTMQGFLLDICRKFGDIPGVRTSGIFDDLMERSIMKIQSDTNIPVTGVIDPITWYNVVEYSKR